MLTQDFDLLHAFSISWPSNENTLVDVHLLGKKMSNMSKCGTAALIISKFRGNDLPVYLLIVTFMTLYNQKTFICRINGKLKVGRPHTVFKMQ